MDAYNWCLFIMVYNMHSENQDASLGGRCTPEPPLVSVAAFQTILHLDAERPPGAPSRGAAKAGTARAREW